MMVENKRGEPSTSSASIALLNDDLNVGGDR